MTTLYYTATYSPEDNKLRLYASQRLDAETYARVRGAGFIWAPKQELFVAPMWTPERAELCEELAGEIGDEDTSLVERAEERAGRFDEYSENRAEDAERAADGVRTLSDGIPLGQPILVGHHSEKHARKDAERIENGMRKAVKMWETSQYWTARAAGALRHAKYKEQPAVRARRIKKLEADQRSQERTIVEARRAVKLWDNLHEPDSLKRKDGTPTTFEERAEFVAGHTNTAPMGTYSDLRAGKITAGEAQHQAINAAARMEARAVRWLEHLGNRLAYERAMLSAGGGTVADRTGPQVGGGVRCWASPRGGWSYIQKVNKVSVTVFDNWGNGGRDFTRTIPFDKLAAVMTPEQVKAARESGELVEMGTMGYALRNDFNGTTPTAKQKPQPAEIDAMRESLRAGVTVAAVAQLFPTPAELAARVVAAASIKTGQRVLEPSAGTGALLDAIRRTGIDVDIVAVEINESLTGIVNKARRVHYGDFLQCNGDLGTFDRVLMNPPFESGADIRHILHAVSFLKPGGRLVAICADGPRQNERLRPLAEQSGGTWEALPPGAFQGAGTGVRTALLVIEAAN